MNKKRQMLLVVLDGWGYREDSKNNAIASAKTHVFDELWNTYPHTLLQASGEAVGLPEGQMGTSEIGHMTIGSGRVMKTDLVKINKEIKDGKYGENKVIKKIFDHVKKNESVLHIMGLVSAGGVHSHQEHLYATLREAKKSGVSKLAIHAFTDGRDSAPKSASQYIKELETVIEEVGIGFIASVSGRYYAMDRDNNWDRTEKAEKAIFECKGDLGHLEKPSDRLEDLYKTGVTDEYVEPVVFEDKNGKTCGIQKDDAIFFFNFRPDRARQITERILKNTKDKNVYFATMTSYNPEFACDVVFPETNVEQTLGGVISRAGLTQTRLAETVKFAHATYFLDGGREDPYEGEDRIMIPSRKDVKTHDEAPEMKAKEIADAVIKEIEKGQDFIFVNFANADMVGHTSNVPKIIEAVEIVDKELGRVIEALNKQNGVAFVTADHGNAEFNIDDNGDPHTAHTTSLVPAIVTDQTISLRDGGGLANVTATILELMDLDKPEEMEGKSLLA